MANSGEIQWYQCLAVRCVANNTSLIPCILSALGLPAAKQSSLTTLAASFLAKWFKSFGTSKWNRMFHFNRSLEGDFAANDMGRCGVWLWAPRVHCTMWEGRGKGWVRMEGGEAAQQSKHNLVKLLEDMKIQDILIQLTYFIHITCCNTRCNVNNHESLWQSACRGSFWA